MLIHYLFITYFFTYHELWFLKVSKGFLDKSWLTKTYSIVFIGLRSQMKGDFDVELLSHFSCKFEVHEAETVVKHVNTGVI
jgi:hypothetical protein